MKLTLEQKAFYEYGRAVESLKRTIYETRETVRLPYAVPLSEIGLARPPQSWQYLTEEQAALLR